MSAPIDCPICMDCIESTTKNCVTTECGHSFHANCLMQNVAHNGFGCPYCRTVMAEQPEEDEEADEEDDEESEWEEDSEGDTHEEDAMRGFRFFWNNLNGEPHHRDDEADEEQFEEYQHRASTNQVQDPNVPSTDFVAQKLREQGVTFVQLVKIICFYDHIDYQHDETAERFSDELFGKIRIVVSNYTPPEQVPPTAPGANPPAEVDFAAQPKTQVRSVPRFHDSLENS